MSDYFSLWPLLVVFGTIYALLFLVAAKLFSPARYRNRVNARLLIGLLAALLVIAAAVWLLDIFINPTR